MPLQRLRIWYRKTDAAADIQPGELGRTWVAALEAAGLEIARPEGSKRVRFELGPALPQGVSGDREPLDVWLAEPVDVESVCARLSADAPAGIEPVGAEELGDRLPSLGASLRAATYRALLPEASCELDTLRARCRALLTAESVPWTEVRGERVREIDLRSFVLDLQPEATSRGVELCMRLVLAQDRVGRPASVLAALGIAEPPLALVRECVEVDRPLVALHAWRTVGRFS